MYESYYYKEQEWKDIGYSNPKTSHKENHSINVHRIKDIIDYSILFRDRANIRRPKIIPIPIATTSERYDRDASC